MWEVRFGCVMCQHNRAGYPLLIDRKDYGNRTGIRSGGRQSRLLCRRAYTRHTSSCMCVGCVQSPESLT
ncbi:hypothetical protein EH203_12480 [Pectobacterium carotovorum subsp. carotovorum]|nr:hypothetical protein EH203_12480 [Pectobacterium carotovorum subsp. carotovorum]